MIHRGLASTVVLASLLAAQPARAQYRVAVVSGGAASSTECAAQLADDTHFDFEATVVAPDEIDTAEELEAFDVVVWGDSGNDDGTFSLEAVAAIGAWVDQEGGGVVSTSWVPYAFDADDPVDVALDALTPIDTQTDPEDRYCAPPGEPLAIDVLGPHPIVDGVADFTTTAEYLNYTHLPADAENAVTLARVGNPTNCDTADQDTYDLVIAGGSGAGRLVYAGFLFQADLTYELGDVRAGASDQILEQAVRWAAGNRDTDGDTVLNEGDNCAFLANTDQLDTDEDEIGDACDDDDDADGLVDEEDNCPLVANDDQADADEDGVGDACEPTGEGGAGGGATASSASSTASSSASTGSAGAGGGGEGAGGGAGGEGDGDGCGCVAVGARSQGRGWALGLGLAGLALLTRRRRG